MHATDTADAVIGSGKRRASAFHSYELLRRVDNSVSLSIGARPSPGNWLALSGTGRMTLNLTFYDTPIASSTGVADVKLPAIIKVGCDA